MEASDESVSTSSRAGCFALSIARRTRGMRVVTPVEVSLCTTHTPLMAAALSGARRPTGGGLVVHDPPRLNGVRLVGGEPRLDFRGVRAMAPVTGDHLDLQP